MQVPTASGPDQHCSALRRTDGNQGNKWRFVVRCRPIVNTLTFVSGTCPGYVIADARKHNLAGDLKFCLDLFNFSVNRASFAFGQAALENNSYLE